MSHQVVLFHSALGLRPAVRSFAERLQSEGYTVHTPDSFDGEVFATLEEGGRKRDALGIPELIRRAEEAVAHLPEGLIFAGFSMGAAAAQYLATTRPGARAAILMDGALAPTAIGLEAWPSGVAVQVHYGRQDSLVNPQDIDALATAVRRSATRIGVYTYPRASHLFSDKDFRDYEAESARLMEHRVLEFLADLDAEGHRQ